MSLLLLLLLLIGCCGDSTVLGSDNVVLPDKLVDAMAYQPEAVRTSLSDLYKVLHAEAEQVYKMRETGQTSTENSFCMVQKLAGCKTDDKKLSYASFLQTACLTDIKQRFSLSNGELRLLLKHMPNILQVYPSTTSESSQYLECPYPWHETSCSIYDRYRTYDGRCNNLWMPLWGSSHQPLARFLPPDYADAISKPRVARSGSELPNARLVSYTVHPDVDNPSEVHTLMLMQFGQFLDHDMSRTAISMLATSDEDMEMENVECGDDGCQTEGPENRECFPIFVPPNDPVYGGHKHCLMFVRSQEVTNEKCVPGPREQVNQLTSFLDASHIYGNTKEDALDLRELTPDRGRLKTSNHPAGNYKPMLPKNPDDKDCRGDDQTIFCFKAGDGRANELSALTTQHTIWVREHNRIEQKLHELNFHWNGERLYQETRRIVIAIWQSTVYNEYLPIIVGNNAMQAYRLQLADVGYWNDYDTNVKPDIANSFATAAMRFGHTQVQGMIRGRDAGYNVINDITLSTQFFRPHVLYERPDEGSDMLMLALLADDVQNRDPFLTDEVTSHLFAENPPHGLGTDLAALNIQRGREHGIPGYNWFRCWCGLKKAETFDDLVEIPANVVDQLRQIYEHVNDIDLWTAGISEIPTNGAILGPTLACIIARQFLNLKKGDRFWFEENRNNPYPFTEDQLAEIRKFRYAKVMCENADYLPTIQPNVFRHPFSVYSTIVKSQNQSVDLAAMKSTVYSEGDNERVPCADLPDLDLTPWADRPSHYAPYYYYYYYHYY